jgi:nucleotide-binding universal stress UspA family protein
MATPDARPVVVGVDGSDGTLLGSVSQALLHRAQCPVNVVPSEVGDA